VVVAVWVEREAFGGRLLWRNMVLWRVGGCLKLPVGRMEWVCGNLFVLDGISFLVLKFEVGDGSLIRFWDDVWCIEEPLKEAFRSCIALLVLKMLCG
jgi:hypothetical protein